MKVAYFNDLRLSLIKMAPSKVLFLILRATSTNMVDQGRRRSEFS